MALALFQGLSRREQRIAAAAAVFIGGATRAATATALGLHRQTVEQAVGRAQQEGRFDDAPRSGRKRKRDTELADAAAASLARDRWQTLTNTTVELGDERAVAGKAQVSRSTVRRAAHDHKRSDGESFGYEPERPAPLLKPHHIAARKEFARRHCNDPLPATRTYVFLDEKHFRAGSTARGRWQYADEPAPVSETVKKPASVYVLGAICYLGQLPLIIPEKGISTDSKDYTKQLQQIANSAHALYGNWNFTIVHDGSGAHSSRYTTEWLNEQPFKYISDWPAHSPDLHVIENLWGIMARAMRSPVDANVEVVQAEVRHLWDNLKPATITALCDSFGKRCDAVYQADGNRSKY